MKPLFRLRTLALIPGYLSGSDLPARLLEFAVYGCVWIIRNHTSLPLE